MTKEVSVCHGSGKGDEALPKHKNYGEEIGNIKKRLLTWGSKRNKNCNSVALRSILQFTKMPKCPSRNLKLWHCAREMNKVDFLPSFLTESPTKGPRYLTLGHSHCNSPQTLPTFPNNPRGDFQTQNYLLTILYKHDDSRREWLMSSVGLYLRLSTNEAQSDWEFHGKNSYFPKKLVVPLLPALFHPHSSYPHGNQSHQPICLHRPWARS